MDDYLVKSIKNYSFKRGVSRTKEQVYFFIKFDGKKYPISFFDELMQVKCAATSNEVFSLISLTKLCVFSLVEPPAPYVTEINLGFIGSNLLILTHKDFIESWFLGGKNSKETLIFLLFFNI